MVVPPPPLVVVLVVEVGFVEVGIEEEVREPGRMGFEEEVEMEGEVRERGWCR